VGQGRQRQSNKEKNDEVTRCKEQGSPEEDAAHDPTRHDTTRDDARRDETRRANASRRTAPHDASVPNSQLQSHEPSLVGRPARGIRPIYRPRESFGLGTKHRDPPAGGNVQASQDKRALNKCLIINHKASNVMTK